MCGWYSVVLRFIFGRIFLRTLVSETLHSFSLLFLAVIVVLCPIIFLFGAKRYFCSIIISFRPFQRIFPFHEFCFRSFNGFSSLFYPDASFSVVHFLVDVPNEIFIPPALNGSGDAGGVQPTPSGDWCLGLAKLLGCLKDAAGGGKVPTEWHDVAGQTPLILAIKGRHFTAARKLVLSTLFLSIDLAVYLCCCCQVI